MSRKAAPVTTASGNRDSSAWYEAAAARWVQPSAKNSECWAGVAARANPLRTHCDAANAKRRPTECPRAGALSRHRALIPTAASRASL